MDSQPQASDRKWQQSDFIYFFSNFYLGIRLEFKVIIQEGQSIYWENGANRTLQLKFIKNYVDCVYGQYPTKIRTFQKYDMSQEYDQDVLDQVERMKQSRDYDPFDNLDSSDNESLASSSIEIELTKKTKKCSEINWMELILNFQESKPEQKHKMSSLEKIEFSFQQMRKRSMQTSVSQMFGESFVAVLLFKIPIKIQLKENSQQYQILSVKDIPNKYSFKVTSDPYISSLYGLFASRLKLTTVWVGWIGLDVPDQDLPYLQQYLFTTYLCYGIRLNGQKYYQSCFLTFLEPIFHNLQVYYEEEQAQLYEELNQEFANVAIDIMHGLFANKYQFSNHLYTIFTLDYHLLLLPIMISEVLYKKDDQRPRLGLILNRNLPSLQNFELLPDSQIVIDSIVLNDVISFIDLRDIQTFLTYLPNYTKQKVPLSTAYIVTIFGRQINLDSGNICLNHRNYQNIQLKLDPKQFIYLMSVDKLSHYSGLEYKFRIIEELFKINENIRLIQFIFQSVECEFQDNQQLDQYYNELKKQAEKINQKYQQIIITIITNGTRDEIINYCIISQAYFKTCLRENTQLNYLEYIHIRSQFKRVPKLIIGHQCRQKMAHLRINIFDYKQSANYIQDYLTGGNPILMTVPDASGWLTALMDLVFESENFQDKQLYYTEKQIVFGSKEKKDNNFNQLFATNTSRVFIINICKIIMDSAICLQKIINTIEQLLREQKNTVIIVSDRLVEDIELKFGQLDGLYIIAQDGLFIKRNSNSYQGYHIVAPLEISFSLPEEFEVLNNNYIFTIQLKERAKPDSIALNLKLNQMKQQLIKDYPDYNITDYGNKIKLFHKYQQIDTLIKVILMNEEKLYSEAILINFKDQQQDQIQKIFDYRIQQKRIICQNFNCISISDSALSDIQVKGFEEMILRLQNFSTLNC
ncbi:hypothetical protein pb186bvf_004725 [Paramecium bursaria]